MSEEQQAEPTYEETPQESVKTDGVATSEENEQTSSSSAENEVVSSSEENNQAYNWKKARQQLEALQWENKKLREQFDQFTSNQATQSEEAELKAIEQEISSLAKDDLLTVEQYEKLAKLRDRKAELKIQELESRLEKEVKGSVDERIKRNYPDFFTVATEENIEELKQDPLFLKCIKGLKDPYDQAELIYKELNKRGMTTQVKESQEALEKNKSKPRSANSLGGASPLHDAHEYSSWPSPELKKKFYEEMMHYAQGS